MADVPRAPSRIGFTRTPLRRQDNPLRLDWSCYEEAYEEDEEWEGEGAYAASLMYPSESGTGSQAEDHSELDPPPMLKPSLPSQTISISCVPVRLLSTTPASLTDPSMTIHEDELVIPDHGLSRSALSHLKEFWNARKSEWTRKEGALARSSASMYGVTQFARESLRDALFGRLASKRAAVPPETTPSASTAPPPLNTPIYPRTGDLLRLRDARFAVMDRAFCNIPLHSITKMLFLHDMLDRSGASTPSSRSGSPASLPKELEDSYLAEDKEASFVDISLSSSNGSSDDDTLVEQGSEPSGGQSQDLAVVIDDPEHARLWEIDWSARWRVLLHTTQSTISSSPHPFLHSLPVVDEDALLEALHSVSVNPNVPACAKSQAPKASPTRTRFFIPEDDDDDDEYFNSYEADTDDDEDYGRILRRTIYTSDAEFYASYEQGLQFSAY